MIAIVFYTTSISGPIIAATVKPEPSSNVTKKLMNGNVATLNFFMPNMVNFAIGDAADILGDTFFISKPVVIKKHSRYGYEYTVVMETKESFLRKAQFLFYDSLNNFTKTDFAFTGTADDFLNLLILNAKRIFTGWTKGGVIATGYKTLTFASEDCYSVLSKIANAFETEFYVENNMIHLAKRQNITSTLVKYGRGNGLYSIDQQLLEDVLFTRLYVYGGTQNLPGTYRNFSPRLLLNTVDEFLITDLMATVQTATPTAPQSTYTFTFAIPAIAQASALFQLRIEYRLTNTVGAWTVDAGNFATRILILTTGNYDFKFTTAKGAIIYTTSAVNIPATTTQYLFQKSSILENNIAKHGVIEGSLIIDDIFPERQSTVTAGNALQIYKFKDATINFDLNAYLIPGISAKVVFNSGQLAGYKFEISKYVHVTKEFTILKNKDELALDLPSTFLRPAIGDAYVLLDILLPQQYVTDAEKRLRVKAEEFLALKSEPAYKYSVECDKAYFRRKQITLQVGDKLHLKDIELQIDRQIRIVSLTRSLEDEYQYTVELGDELKPGLIQSLQSGVASSNTTSQATSAQLNNSALFNGTYIGIFTIEQGTLKLKDVDPYAVIGNLKQLFVDTDGKVYKAP